MAISYPVELDIHLRSIWHNNPPEINIGINNDIQRIMLSKDQIFHYKFISDKSSIITVELLNKTDADTVPNKGLDKAVIIESVGFFGILDDRFIWLGEYCPEYPEPCFLHTIQHIGKVRDTGDRDIPGGTGRHLDDRGRHRGGAALRNDDAVHAETVGSANERTEILRILNTIEQKNDTIIA